MEWSVVAGVILVLIFVSSRQMRVLQVQAELSAVKATLGALRTAFVIDHLHKQVLAVNPSVVTMQRNPFELLERRPLNYLGQLTLSEAAAAPAGSWLFEPVCGCVGYVPLFSQWFVSPTGDFVAWYVVSTAPGPLLLTAKAVYAWHDDVIN